MKNKLTRNWGLKLGSFIVAVTLWIIVTNINDPIISYKVSDVAVTIRNADLITDSGQIYEVLDGTDVIDTVTILAPRSIIDSLDKSNVVAIADMNDLTSLDTIPIRLSTNKYNDKLDSIRGNIDNVKLNIEAKKSKSLPIRATTAGGVREGYMIGDVTTEQNLIKVTGPESIISQITKAQVEVDVSGFTSNIGTDSTIRLYDENGKEVNSNGLEKSITKVRVNVEILEMKRVPISYTVTGSPEAGYLLNGQIESTRDTVLIAGKSKIIDNVNSIEIPEGVIDITGTKEDVTALIDLKDYLPEGVIIADSDFTGKVNVTVFVEQEMRREVTIPVENVRIVNVPEGYVAEIISPEDGCRITLRGLAADLQAADLSSVEAFVDVAAWMQEQEMENLEVGTYYIELGISLPDGSPLLHNDVDIELHITERE